MKVIMDGKSHLKNEKAYCTTSPHACLTWPNMIIKKNIKFKYNISRRTIKNRNSL